MLRYGAFLNKFKDLMKSGIFNVFKKFKSIIKGVLKFADILSFITVLADFELCYPIPQKCEKTIKINLGFKKIKIKIPWVSTILSLDLTLSELTCITQHHFMFDTIDPDSRFQICWGTKVRRISILGLAWSEFQPSTNIISLRQSSQLTWWIRNTLALKTLATSCQWLSGLSSRSH